MKYSRYLSTLIILVLVAIILYLTHAMHEEQCIQTAVLRNIAKNKKVALDPLPSVILDGTGQDTALQREVRSVMELINSLDGELEHGMLRQETVLDKMQLTKGFYEPMKEQYVLSIPAEMRWLTFKEDLYAQWIERFRMKFASNRPSSRFSMCINEILIDEGTAIHMDLTPIRNWPVDSNNVVYASGMRVKVDTIPFKYFGYLKELEVVSTNPYTNEKRSFRYEKDAK